MTLGLKFFCSSKMAVTRRRSKLWWRISHQSKALDVSYLSSLSKRNLKHSGTFFKNLHTTLDSQLIKYFDQKAPAGILRESFYKIFQKKGPCGHIKGALLQNIQKKRPLREYLATPFIIYIYIYNIYIYILLLNY